MVAAENEDVPAPTVVWKVLQVFSLALRAISIVLIAVAVTGLHDQEVREFTKNQQMHKEGGTLSDFLLDGKCAIYTIPQENSAGVNGPSVDVANLTTGIGIAFGAQSDPGLEGPCGWFSSVDAYTAHLQEEWNGQRGCDPQTDESDQLSCCTNCWTNEETMYNLFPSGGLPVFTPNFTVPLFEAYIYLSLLALKIWMVVRRWRQKEAWSFFNPTCFVTPRKGFFNVAMFFVVSFLPGVIFAPVMSATIHDGKYFEVKLYTGVVRYLIVLTLLSQILVQAISAIQLCCDWGKCYAGAMEVLLTLPVWFVPLMIWSTSFGFDLTLVFSFDFSWSIGIITCFVQLFQTLALVADLLAQVASRTEMIRKAIGKAKSIG